MELTYKPVKGKVFHDLKADLIHYSKKNMTHLSDEQIYWLVRDSTLSPVAIQANNPWFFLYWSRLGINI